MMAQSQAKSTWEINNYARYINQFPPNIIKSIRQYERINKKYVDKKCLLCSTKYIYIYTHTHTHTHTHIYIYISVSMQLINEGALITQIELHRAQISEQFTDKLIQPCIYKFLTCIMMIATSCQNMDISLIIYCSACARRWLERAAD